MARRCRLHPDYVDGHFNLAVLFCVLGKWEQAKASFRRTLSLNPDHVEAHQRLAGVLGEEGFVADAQKHNQESLRLAPSSRKRIALATFLPIVYQSEMELLEWRRRLIHSVRALRNDELRIDLNQDLAMHCFYSAYHGMNDRDLQHDLAELYVLPRPTPPSSTGITESIGKKIRVGFISQNFKDHTIGRLMRGVMAPVALRVPSDRTVSGPASGHNGRVDSRAR